MVRIYKYGWTEFLRDMDTRWNMRAMYGGITAEGIGPSHFCRT